MGRVSPPRFEIVVGMPHICKEPPKGIATFFALSKSKFTAVIISRCIALNVAKFDADFGANGSCLIFLVRQGHNLPNLGNSFASASGLAAEGRISAERYFNHAQVTGRTAWPESQLSLLLLQRATVICLCLGASLLCYSEANRLSTKCQHPSLLGSRVACSP